MIGTKLAERYEITGELGRGGMGVVYKAKDPVLNRDVALKLIPPGNLTKDAEDRFLREAQIVAQMDHPGIVPIYDLGRHQGALFFVMPVLPGTTLRHLLRDGSLRLGDMLDIGTQVAEALDYSHARGVIHRDVKPENIMTAREESGHVRARVMDFGLALATQETRLTRTGMMLGTVGYFSPEQIAMGSWDGRSDVYALGTVLYECLTGEPPFSGPMTTVMARIVKEPPQTFKARGVEVNEELEKAIFHALEKDPEKRPKRAAHFADALRRYRAKLHEEEYSRTLTLSVSKLMMKPPAAATPLIGREKEIAELQRKLHAALAGECQLALVAGEPGIGKSRLVEELVTLAHARKIRVLSGRFVEQDRAFAHQGFCELIQDYFRPKESASSVSGRPDFSDLATDLISLFPVLGEIPELRAAAGNSGLIRAARAEDKTTVFELLARTLARIAQSKPLMVVLEELHGAEQSIEALQYVARRLGPTPTLILGTYRQTEVDKRHPLMKLLESFRGDPRFTHITLAPFSASEYRALVEAMAGGGKASEALVARLHEATEGNPLFTKELVRSLVEAGTIGKDDSGSLNLSVAGILLSGVLPETMQQAVQARIERLPPSEREVLAIASVLGRSFDDHDLEALVEDVEGVGDLDDAVDKLVGEGLLEERQEARGGLAFASGIVRDVLYNGLSRRKRKALHKKYAALLEKRHAGRQERVTADLLHHFTQADMKEKAVEYGLKLAQKSLDTFSPEEAARLARVALDHVEDESWSGEKALEGEAHLLLARAEQAAGRVEPALKEAEAAVNAFEREQLPARAMAAILFAAETAWHARRAEETRRLVERGLKSAQPGTGRELLQKLLALATTVANLRGEYQKAAAYQAHLERLAPKETRAAAELPRGGMLVVALANPLSTSDPALRQTAEDTEVLGNTVFETLLTTDPEGILVPLLCDEWKLKDGGRSVWLRLKRGVRFSDGSLLTAAAVKASFEHAIGVRPELVGALAAIQGAEELRSGASAELAGVRALSEFEVEIALAEPLPVFPALLTDLATAMVTVEEKNGAVLGTGPFMIASFAHDRLVLERNPHSSREPGPRLDRIDFRMGRNASAIAHGLREGSVELGRDLLPQDLELLLREPRFRAGLVERPKKGTYFAIFSKQGKVGSNRALRQALAGATRAQDFVWGALGRVAVPATGILPPGILAHDPGRRRPLLPPEKARQAIEALGLARPLTLTAAVHPILQDRFRAATSALLAVWRGIGVELAFETTSMDDFLAAQKRAAVDVVISRWIADYDDPDDFTYSLFHSAGGLYKDYFSSPESDRLLEEARAEARPAAREALYRRFEQMLLDEAGLIPLFHEVDYRIAGPGVKGLKLGNTPPFVNYAEIAKVAAAGEELPVERAGGVIHVPIPGKPSSLDPALLSTNEESEIVPLIFETLTRDLGGARIVPWLATEVRPEAGLTRFRFLLRPGVRFHDGRRLTARDVRFSLERALLTSDGSLRANLAVIRGAGRLIEGQTSELEGFRIDSPREFTIDLEKPISFFPVLLSFPGTAIVPEGTGAIGGSWKSGCVGTGPFRVGSFERERLLTLQRNPDYWRDGYPKCDGLEFHFGTSPQQIKERFLDGRLSIASDLLPQDVEALRQDPRFRGSYQEALRLVTYFIAFNIHRGPLADAGLRRGLAAGIDAAGIVRRTLPRLAAPATGLIPPGLPGHSGVAAPRAALASSADQSIQPTAISGPVELTAIVNPVYLGEYSPFLEELVQAFRQLGFALRILNQTMEDWLAQRRKGEADLVITRWIGDYPDADTFAYGVLNSRDGVVGRYCGSPEVDELVERGRTEIEPGIRHSIYREVEETVARDALLLPFFHEQSYRFARPEVDGLSVDFSIPVVSYENLSLKA